MKRDWGPARSAARLFVKEIVWNVASLSRPTTSTKKNICVYSSRRGGSTLLMQFLAAERGVTFCDQPFGLYTASPFTINRLPLFEYGQVINMDAEEEQLVREYLEGLMSLRHKANAPWRFWETDYSFRCDRVVLKITDAKGIIDWIDRNFDVHTVVCTRHPIAQALSVMRNNWLVTGKAFLRNPHYVDTYLTPELLAYCRGIYESGPPLHRHVLDWGLENLNLLTLLPQRKHWLYVAYEDLVMNPEQVADVFCERLGLEDRERMLRRVRLPSRSTKRGSTRRTKKRIAQGDRDFLISKWKEEVSESEEKECFDILQRLGIRLYGQGRPFPDYSLLHRKPYNVNG